MTRCVREGVSKAAAVSLQGKEIVLQEDDWMTG